MQTTAKSLQLIDASGINISPVTDLTSLYYEVEREYENNKIIARKYVYSGFPIAVNIDPDINVSIGSVSIGSTYSSNDNLYYKLVENDTSNDIIVSNISTSIIPGTTYRQLNVKNYNLSEILTHYTTRELYDASINDINDKIGQGIGVLDNSVNYLYNALNTDIINCNDLLSLANNELLYPNKFYLINNYYSSGLGGCMDISSNQSNSFSGPNSSESLQLLVRANSSTSLDYKLYNMYDHNGNALDVYGTYNIVMYNNKPLIRITQMKDKFGNEAPYDFYNLKMQYKANNYYTFSYGDSNNNALLISGNIIRNNIIKTNPFNINNMIIFKNKYAFEITNNYIGYDTLICIIGDINNNKFQFKNNIIGDSNTIGFLPTYDNEFILNNSIIGNNNTLYDFNDSTSFNHNNLNIGDSNTIYIQGLKHTTNMHIGSSNFIRLINNDKDLTTNIIILNNNKLGEEDFYNTGIKVNDNIIIDGYNNQFEILDTSTNCAYLFGQSIYAKSFNTLK